MAKEKDKKEEEKVPVKLGDSFNTIIYISKGEDKERAIKKILQGLGGLSEIGNHGLQ